MPIPDDDEVSGSVKEQIKPSSIKTVKSMLPHVVQIGTCALPDLA
jgi:hypothetical protein